LGSPLARQTVAYGAVNAISSALSLAVGPILTHYLVPTDYGIAALFVAAFNFLDPIVGLGVIGAFRRRYFQKEEYDYPSYVLSGSLFCLAQAVLVTVLLVATYPMWGQDEVSRVWALAFFPWVVGKYLISAVAVQLQLQKRPLSFGAFAWSNNLLNAGATLCFVVALGYGWQGRVLGQVIAALAVGVVAAFVLAKLVGRGGRWHWHMVKDAVAFGAPAVPYGLLDRGIHFGDRVLLASISGIEQAGLYTLGTNISGLLSQVAASFNLAWQPWLFEQLKAGTSQAARRVVFAFYIAAGALLSMSVSVWLGVRWLFPFIIGERFMPAVALLPWLCIGLGLRGMATLLAGIVIYSGKTKILTQIAVIVAALHLIGLVAMITWNGSEGAAQATFMAYALNLLLVWWRARRLVPLPGL
jgi:O-antigen/teichoic acid export membrane protein